MIQSTTQTANSSRGAGGGKQKLFRFLINQVIQSTTLDVVTHSVLSVLLPTLSPHKIAADPVYS